METAKLWKYEQLKHSKSESPKNLTHCRSLKATNIHMDMDDTCNIEWHKYEICLCFWNCKIRWSEHSSVCKSETLTARKSEKIKNWKHKIINIWSAQTLQIWNSEILSVLKLRHSRCQIWKSKLFKIRKCEYLRSCNMKFRKTWPMLFWISSEQLQD